MVPEILNAWLWQARLSTRTGGACAFAAHGYVDPAYRPPWLPFVSVVGPLSLHVVSWGTRTLSSDPGWRYVPVRRIGEW
jgi:hypothetical protein